MFILRLLTLTNLPVIRQIQRVVSMKTINENYEGAINLLNGLISNAQYIKNYSNNSQTPQNEFSNTILQMQKYMLRAGVTFERLENISVIHITGTKGKGTTSAFCESILRNYGFRTGFYSSPHLIEVRERIRIDGKPISHKMFSSHFFTIYKKLISQQDSENDMPAYFRFLTIMAFKIFIDEQVDVAIIEVGIGGEYDCTNVLRNVPVIGITSVGLDHTNILGNTVEKISWHKAGIMKENCKAFTVPQLKSVMDVIENRAIEKKCSLQVVDKFVIEEIKKLHSWPSEVLATNATLAIFMCESWIMQKEKNLPNNFKLSPTTINALKTAFWPGRFQILNENNLTFYIDGAHTVESIKLCAEWFMQKTDNSTAENILIFNTTGDRNSESFLSILEQCRFSKVMFVPNLAKSKENLDNSISNNLSCEQIKRCKIHRQLWLNLSTNSFNDQEVLIYPNVIEALKLIDSNKHFNILVTGSIHLVGATLSILDPELSGGVRENTFNHQTRIMQSV